MSVAPWSVASLLVLATLSPIAAQTATAAPAAEPAASVTAAKQCQPKKGADCRGADLRKADLSGRNLTGIDLRGARLSKADLSKAILNKAKLHKADLRRSNLKRATIKKAQLPKAQLNGANLKRAHLGKSNLVGARLNNANLLHTVLRGASLGDDQATTYALPDDGQQIVQFIDSAQKTVDITIYEIGGPNIVGQPGSAGALMRAVARGVDVRIILNPQWFLTGPNCGASPAEQSACAANNKIDWAYATQASLQAAAQGVSGAGSVYVGAGANNFNIIHEKAIVVDAADPTTGAPLAASDLPSTAAALVSTGNLQSYGWGYKSVTNPITGCYKSQCAPEWGARDFFTILQEPDLVSEVESVFFSDRYCGAVPPSTTPSTTNTNGLMQSNNPLTWSNGSTNGTSYPPVATGYDKTYSVEQGNARERIEALIKSADKSLLIYNEEMGDSAIVDLIAAKAKQLGPGKVQVIMTLSTGWLPEWYELAQAGVKIRLFQVDNDSNDSKQLYIHGKVVVADGTDAFLGSENIGTGSLDENRELGLMLTTRTGASAQWLNSVQGVTTLINTFDQDWGTPGILQWDITTGQSQMKAQARVLAAQAAQAPVAPDVSATSTWTYNYPLACGALPARS